MELIELFVRRCAKRTTRDGRPILVTDGDPLLVAAFGELGWSDPYEDAAPAPMPLPAMEVAVEARAPEQAIEVHPSER